MINKYNIISVQQVKLNKNYVHDKCMFSVSKIELRNECLLPM